MEHESAVLPSAQILPFGSSLLDDVMEKEESMEMTAKQTKRHAAAAHFTGRWRYIGGGADKSLVWPTSRCRRTGSIVSLERGVCSCAELQVFSYYRSWKEACQATRAISTTSRRELSSSFFFLQDKAPKDNWGTFWRKSAEGRSPRGSCSCTTMPRLTGHLQTQEKLAYLGRMSWSPTLFNGSGPVGLPSVLWTEKAIERSPSFFRRGGHCYRGGLVGRTTFWIFFLSGLQKF